MWIRTTAFGMQAFWYYLAWALPRALKAALLSMSSTPLNFGYPGDSLIFRRKIAFFIFLAWFRFHGAQVQHCFRSVIGSSPLSFARRGCFS
jgi:hypothetical protein